MAILAECPTCHNKQSTRNKVCKCGESMDKAKKSKRVRYWISYRMPGGKQRKEAVANFEDLNPYSIEDARTAEAKRKVQKKERRILDMLPEATMTFNELAEWYLELKSVKRLATYRTIQWAIAKFNKTFGNLLVGTLRPIDLEDFQDQREEEGAAPATIDYITIRVGTMVRKAWDNDMVDGRTVKAFIKVKNKLKTGSNARDRILTPDEYQRVRNHAAAHLEALIITAYHTGMRQGELLKLKWSYIDREKGFIRLPAEITKERKPKSIPINHHVKKVLDSLPRALHHDFVFTYQGKPIGSKIVNAFKGACNRAGIAYGTKVEGGLRFHDIRITFKTNMLRAGVDKVLRDTILGHSLEGMDTYYLKPADEDLKQAMEKFTTWIDAQTASVAYPVTQEGKSG
jgi:integrase